MCACLILCMYIEALVDMFYVDIHNHISNCIG